MGNSVLRGRVNEDISNVLFAQLASNTILPIEPAFKEKRMEGAQTANIEIRDRLFWNVDD